MKFLYLKPNKSGIGDRLLDLILVYTYSKYLKYNELYLCWQTDSNLLSKKYIHSYMRRIKTPFRDKDYLLHNLLKYINLPNDIIFVNKQKMDKLISEGNYQFKRYMGLKYTVHTFIEKILPNIDKDDKDKFIDSYYNNFKNITFNNIPENIITTFNNNEIVTIHLRRGDKVVDDNGESIGIRYSELDDLNKKTDDAINKCISLNFKNICFVSDEKKIRNQFIEKFKDKCNIFVFDGDDYSQTYYDIYCLVNSKFIILSQRFSVFSIFSSMIKNINLYYILDNNMIKKFNEYSNIKKIGDLNKL
jgi:hypothetical protein